MQMVLLKRTGLPAHNVINKLCSRLNNKRMSKEIMSKTTVGKSIQLIGRKTDFRGQSLWEILYGLSDYGVGRLVIRNIFQRYSEPCYYRILDVDPKPSEPTEHGIRKVRVLVEKTWRGVTASKPVEIYKSSYKADYELVPRHLEAKYTQNKEKITEKVLPNTIAFPPLLREFITEQTGEAAPMMKLHFKKTPNKFVRLAADGEKPSLAITMDLGTPISPKLYYDGPV